MSPPYSIQHIHNRQVGYCTIVRDQVPDLVHDQGKPQMNVYWILPIPFLQRGWWPWGPSSKQAAYPLSLVLVLIYVYWHAISCSITFTCHAVNQQGFRVMGGNRIRITFCPYWLVYLHRDGDSGCAKDIRPGILLSCHVSSVNVCAAHQDV